MSDLESLIPKEKQKPHIWGQRYVKWQDLDRKTLMGLLALVRQRYLEGYAKYYTKHYPEADAETKKKNEAKLIVLQEIREQTLGLLEKVPDDMFQVVPESETWSCHDLVNHLAVDEDGEFYPGPPDTLMHRIGTDMVHARQLRRFLHKLGVVPMSNPPDVQGIAT